MEKTNERKTGTYETFRTDTLDSCQATVDLRVDFGLSIGRSTPQSSACTSSTGLRARQNGVHSRIRICKMIEPIALRKCKRLYFAEMFCLFQNIS